MSDNILHVIADDAKGLTEVMRAQYVADAVGSEQPFIPATRAGDDKLARCEEQTSTHRVCQADSDGGKFGAIVGAVGQQLRQAMDVDWLALDLDCSHYVVYLGFWHIDVHQ